MDYSSQASLFMGFPRQEYWSGLLFPPPGDLPDPEMEPRSPTLQADSLLSEPRGKPLAAAAKSLQSCPTLCDPIDSSPTRLPRPWDSQGKNTGVGCHFRLQCVKVKSLSRVRLLTTPWTVAYQSPPSMGFSRQEYWSGVPLPSLGKPLAGS